MSKHQIIVIQYKFNEKTGIIETTVKGTVTINDFIEYISALSKDKLLSKKVKILTDASNGKFFKNVNPEDLYRVVEINNKSLAKSDFICDAFIISSSMETALAQLYKEYSKADNYYFNFFSTKEAALKWLNSFD